MALAGTELRLADCQLRACGEGGIVVAGRVAAENCSVDGCGGVSAAAVAVRGGGRLEMRTSSIERAAGMGVQMADGAEAQLHQMRVLGCAKAGYLPPTTYCLLPTNYGLRRTASA